MTYTEDTLVSRKPPHENEIKISDLATKEFLETLKSADVLKDDWEVVFPDCPIRAHHEIGGLFSITG